LYNRVQASRHEDLFVFKVPVSVIIAHIYFRNSDE
jgi:hypothetical protein